MHYSEWRGERLTGVAIKHATIDCLEALNHLKVDPAVIVMRGVSGMTVGFPLATKLGCQYCVLRKPNEDSHDCGDLVGSIPQNGTVVIVDDFCSSGHTLTTMVETIHAKRPYAEIVVLLYSKRRRPDGKPRLLSEGPITEMPHTKAYYVGNRRD